MSPGHRTVAAVPYDMVQPGFSICLNKSCTMSPGHRTVAAGVVRSGFQPDIGQPVSEVRSQAVGFFAPPRLPTTWYNQASQYVSTKSDSN